ncbi:PAAR domain-containing protein [Polyangium jinanense]|uniref:PAAR domain-containing protein n=1 Tax=Polyangium jinanense TaxID=2829994 RepID=A0A9X3XCM1_9BACT|nr:PAAR domain-containing protein [Polyangium jinanense]MDC3986238.1 PAAR domain-containing protein [Polyangium jinanense]
MGSPGAKEGDCISGIDTHVVLVPSPGGPVPTPTLMPFAGTLAGGLASDVFLDDKPAATEGSTARNQPAHVPVGGSFQTPPSNEARVQKGSGSVFIENKPAARMGDPATTCNDPADAPNGRVIASGTVFIGG